MATSTSRPAARRDAPEWLDDVEMSAWRGYLDSFASLRAVLEADLAPHGLAIGDYEVLVRLSESPDRQMRMCDLAVQLRLSPSGLTRRLDGLVRGKLVRREPSSQDRRVMLATLTDAGLAALTEAAPTHLRGVREHFIGRLDRAEVEALAAAFAKIRGGLACPETAEQAQNASGAA
jgi:DNA-binding MarR family transcriptional regulator